MKFERRKLADLRPAEYNPRKKLTPEDKEYQDIKRSILEFGYADPIVINFDGTIIKGHQRRTVMMDLGYEDAEVIVLDIQDKTKEKALNTALNKITGKWDNQMLKDLLVELDLEGYDFSVTGFQRTDLEDLIQLTEVPPEAQEDDFDPDAAAEAIDVPVSRAGNIWRLGRHRLMCGDATDPDDVAQLLAGEKLDLVITDPPYNVDYGAKTEFLEAYLGQEGSRKNSTIENDHMDTGSFYSFLLAAFQNFNEAMRPGAAIYVFHAESTGLQFRQAYADAGLKLSQCLVWEKNAFVMGRSDYQWRHEPILYGWKEGGGALLRERPHPGHGLPGGWAGTEEDEQAAVAGPYREGLPGLQRPDHRPLRKQAHPQRSAPDHEARPAGGPVDEQLQPPRLGRG